MIVSLPAYKIDDLKYSLNKYLQFFKKFMAEYPFFSPDGVYKLYLVNCPFVFRALWKAFLPFIPSVTRKKISVLGTDYRKSLLKDGIEEVLDDETDFLSTDLARIELSFSNSGGTGSIERIEEDAPKPTSSSEEKDCISGKKGEPPKA